MDAARWEFGRVENYVAALWSAWSFENRPGRGCPFPAPFPIKPELF
jgi:hypothetical protein